jgi:hypothetical protein
MRSAASLSVSRLAVPLPWQSGPRPLLTGLRGTASSPCAAHGAEHGVPSRKHVASTTATFTGRNTGSRPDGPAGAASNGSRRLSANT